MKKVIISTLAIMLAVLAVFGGAGKTFVSAAAAPEMKFESKSALLMAENGQVLFSQNENARLPVASMTKIATLILAFEEIEKGNLKLDDKVVVSQNAAGMGGSQVFLAANEEYKVSDLIKSIIVASGNDASVAIAETIAGTQEEFVSKMNQKASELGLKNTNFANCTGLPAPGGYSSALDMAVLMKELIKHKDYFTFSKIWMDNLEHSGGRVSELVNTNKLVRFYEGCDGGKTGSTSEAGFCVAATAEKNNLRLISVIIGGENSKLRFAEASKLFNYGFGAYENRVIVEENFEINANIERGKQKQVKIKSAEGFSMVVKKGDKRSVEVTTKVLKEEAPVKAGEEVGEIIIAENGEVIKTIKLISSEDISEKNYYDYVKAVIEEFFID